MRVLRLRAENFKRLTAVDITPAGDVVTITGRNAQGKSSVLDAIFAALGGGRGAAQPDVPIRKGAKEGHVTVNLGPYIVTRKWRESAEGKVTTSLVVENGDGARFPSAQTLIDKLIGDLSFDPLAFARMKPRDQFDALAKFVDGVNLDEVANLNRGDYEKRTDVNRRAKEARAAASVIVVPAEIPAKVDEKALVDEMTGATQRDREIAEHNRRRETVEKELAAQDRRISDYDVEIRELEDRLADLREILVNTRTARSKTFDSLQAFPAAPERIDVSAVAAKLNAARDTNRSVDDMLRKAEQKASVERLAASLEGESEQLTARIDARNAAKDKAISAAQMPVDGLGFGDGEILLNGVPFTQGSSAEQLRTSVAIAAAMNPTLRVIHIRDGSLLDADSMAWLAEYAKTHDLQVWCEVVGTDEKVGVLIEDGHVRQAETGEKAA